MFRNEEWLTGGIYGICNIPRPSVFGWSAATGRATSISSASPIWR